MISNCFNSTSVSVEKYFFYSSIALILVFAWMEPAGSAGIGFGIGIVFWTIQISILIPLLIATQHFISHYMNRSLSDRPWIKTTLSGIVAALLFVPIAYLLDIFFSIPDDSYSMHIMPALLDEASGVVVPVTITWLALNAPWILQLDFSKKILQNQNYSDSISDISSIKPYSNANRFLSELKKRARGDLISISSELHYLRVTTTDSQCMFLYNLKDAIEEIPSSLGIQIHRSHWVSRKHIIKLTKKNGNYECLLLNGNKLPVSRRKHAEVRGLLREKSHNTVDACDLP
jgi:hypothetical protein